MAEKKPLLLHLVGGGGRSKYSYISYMYTYRYIQEGLLLALKARNTELSSLSLIKPFPAANCWQTLLHLRSLAYVLLSCFLCRMILGQLDESVTVKLLAVESLPKVASVSRELEGIRWINGQSPQDKDGLVDRQASIPCENFVLSPVCFWQSSANVLKQHFHGQTLTGNIQFSERLVIKSPEYLWDLLEPVEMAELQGQRGLGNVAKSSFRLAAHSAFCSCTTLVLATAVWSSPLKVGMGRFLTAFLMTLKEIFEMCVFNYIREAIACANHLLQLPEEILIVIIGFHPAVEKACALPPAVFENTWLAFHFCGKRALSPAVAKHCQCQAQKGRHFCKRRSLPSSVEADGDIFFPACLLWLRIPSSLRVCLKHFKCLKTSRSNTWKHAYSVWKKHSGGSSAFPPTCYCGCWMPMDRSDLLTSVCALCTERNLCSILYSIFQR